jgi:hypothetical protein
MGAASSQDDGNPAVSWSNLAFEWLRHCAARVREQPQYFEAVHFCSSHFQMVPIPAALLQALASREKPPDSGAPPEASP